MTTPAAAPASAPIAPPPPRAPSQPPADAHGFAAVLDALPGGPAKAGASTAEGEPRPSNEKRLDQPPGQNHSLPGDGSLLASLPFALQAASMIGAAPHAEDSAPSPGPPAAKGPAPEGHGASAAASATTAALGKTAGLGNTAALGKTTSLGRLIGERAFHFGASPSASGLASQTLGIDPSFAPVTPASFAPEANPGGGPALAAGLPAAAAIASRPGKPAANRPGPVRPAHVGSGPKPEAAAPPPAIRAPSPARTSQPAGSSGEGRGADRRPPDPAASAAQPAAQAGPFGAPLPAAFGAAAPFAPDGPIAGAAGAADFAPRASASGPTLASAAAPVREIDVDLSPGGLEDVSMTMRLAGDRLSLVVRAASSHTLSSIEGARDAIADRLAAIGQPLDSLIIKQTGVKADGTTNGNPASADDGPAGDTWRPAQGAGERGGSNDAASRRGAHRDRGY